MTTSPKRIGGLDAKTDLERDVTMSTQVETQIGV
jgi:hypothetical protein